MSKIFRVERVVVSDKYHNSWKISLFKRAIYKTNISATIFYKKKISTVTGRNVALDEYIHYNIIVVIYAVVIILWTFQ